MPKTSNTGKRLDRLAFASPFYMMTNSAKLKSFLEQHPSGASLTEIAAGLGINYNCASAMISTCGLKLGVCRIRRGYYRLAAANGHEAANEAAIGAQIAALEQQKDALTKRIQWTSEEVEGVANALFQIWKRDPIKPISGNDCIRAMHVAVHPQRWRKRIGGLSQLPSVERLIREKTLAFIHRPEPDIAAIQESDLLAAPEPQLAPIDLQTVPFSDLATAYHLRREQIDEQSRADVRALMDLILESRETPAPTAIPAPVTTPTPPTAPPKSSDNRVRVFTFGLLGSQAHEIREEIQKCGYPVHYLKNVETGDKAHVPQSTEFVIFNNKHCSHAVFENVRKQTRALGVPLILATGAGKAKEAIRLLAGGQREPGAFAHLCV